jgi:predicted transcriptional regulator
MLGLLLNRYVISGIVLLLVIGGGIAYAKISADTIRDLREQVGVLIEQEKMLEVTNRALVDDVARIQQAQTIANRKLEAVRLAAIQATRVLMTRSYDARDIPALQQQVNKDMTDALQRLGDLSRAP